MIKNRLLIIIFFLLGAILVPNNSYSQTIQSDSLTIKDLNSYSSYFNKLLSNNEYETLKEKSQLLCNQLKDREDINKSMYATALFYLSAVSAKLSEYESAIKYGVEVVELYKEQTWNTNYGLALTCAVIADSYSHLKDYHNAIFWAEQSLAYKKAVYQNRESLDISLTYGKLSTYYFEVNQKEKALEYAENSFRIKRVFLSPHHKDCVAAAVKLSVCYYDLKYYSKAINLAKEYVYKKVKIENVDAYLYFCSILSHSYYAIGYNSLSQKYAKEGYKVFKQQHNRNQKQIINHIKHLPLSSQIAIEKSILKKHKKHRLSEYYCSLQQNLAGHYYEKCKINKAIELQLECLNNRKLMPEVDSVKYCESLNHLVHFYLAKEDSINFYKYQEESTNITRRVFGEESYEYVDLLRNKYWGSLFWNKSESIVFLDEFLNTYKKLLNREFISFTYNEKFNLWNTINDFFYEEYVNLYLQSIYDGTINIEKYNSNLFNNILFYKELILDSQLEDICIEYKEHNALVELQPEKELKQTKLGNHIHYKWDDVQEGLDSTSIAIEFMEVDSKELIALIVSTKLNFPYLVYICSVENLKRYKNDYFNTDFTHLIWSNIIPYCTDVNNIYISLDGYINSFAIENLPIEKVYNKEYNIYRLSSTRKLIEKEVVERENCSPIFLYGGLDYGENPNIQQGNIIKWEKLPETLNEIKNISEIAESKGYNTYIYSGREGTEFSVRNLLSSNARIIHFATHSYYFSEKHCVETPALMRLVNEDQTTNDISLIRSGLLLSDINSTSLFERADIPSDGILTSYEIANFDLSNTDLVVLSTCQSALGEVSKEGIFGLQRAFREAGAKSILMSLWNVDDLSTQLLMTEFYKNYLSGISKYKSLKAAQQYVREYEDEEGNRLFEDPSYWAGFILLDALD